MATSGRAILQAHIDGVLPESIPIDIQWTLTGVIEILPTSLSSGDNTITVPTGTKLFILIPPPNNAATLKLKGAGADVGNQSPSNLPNIFAWAGGPVIVNASVSVNPVTFIFLG